MEIIQSKHNSNIIMSYINKLLSPFFENIDFKILFHQKATVFYIKELELRKDLLKKLGIPLELNVGKVTEIKLSIENLITLSQMELEITGIKIEVTSNYLTKTYQNDSISIKKHLLAKWEAIHQQIFKHTKKKENNTFIENFLYKSLSELKITIKFLRFVIVDNRHNSETTDKKQIKKLEFKIAEIYSGQYINNEEYQNKQITKISREIKIQKLTLNIYKHSADDDYESINAPDPFLQPLNFNITLNHFLDNYKPGIGEPIIKKNEIFIDINEPIILNISKEKILFLVNFLDYFSKTDKIKKYWIYRPDIDKILTYQDGVEMLRFAYKSLRQEYRKKQNKNTDSYWFKDAINIERYTQYYKSRQFLFGKQTNKEIEELKKMEDKMSIENILHCREYIFNILLKENKNNINGIENIFPYYKYSLNQWLSFRKSIKKKEEKIKQKIEKDEIILNFIKGEPSDTIIKLNININLIIINLIRKLKNKFVNKNELFKQMKYYHQMFYDNANSYFNEMKSDFTKQKNLHIFEWINLLETDNLNNGSNCLKDAIMEEIKFLANKQIQNKFHLNDNAKIINKNKSSEDEFSDISIDILGKKLSNLHTTMKNKIQPTQTNNIPELVKNQNFPSKYPPNISQLRSLTKVNSSNFIPLKKIHYLFGNLQDELSKKTLKKIMISIIFTNISIQMILKRSNGFKLDAQILTLNILDHNFCFTIANVDNASLLKDISSKKYDENFKIENYPFNNEQEAFDGIIINYLLDAINDDKIRDKILTENFLPEEKKFLSEVSYQFKNSVSYIKPDKKNPSLLFEFYSSIFCKYLFQKNLLNKLIELIKEILKDEPDTIKYLLTPDESNFKSSFILRLCEKIIYYFNPEKKKNNNLENSIQSINLSKIQENNPSNNNSTNLNNNNISKFLLNQMEEDIITLFKLINLTIIQYIFSPLMPYFYIENKAFEHFFRNLSHYSNIMKKGYVCKDNNNVLNLSFNKIGLIPINNYDTNYLNLSIDRKISFNLSNETLAELSVFIPSILDNFKKSNYVCSGDLYDDLKASYMDLYDCYMNLKKDFFYIFQKDIENFDEEIIFNNRENERIINEPVYIEKTKYKNDKKKKEKIQLLIKLNSLSIHIFDKIFFISTGICSILNISLKNISINNEELTDFPISKNNKINIQYNQNIFDPYSILTLLNKTSINIQKIIATIDMKESLLETDLIIDIIKSRWENIHFLPNIICDFYSNKILINIVPGIIKIINLFTNLSYFQTLYKKTFGIVNISKLNVNEKKKPKIKTANINQIISYIDDIKKVFEYDENIFPLKYYFINRPSEIFNYTIGKLKDNNNGIIIKLSCDNLNSFNFEENLIGIQIPLVLLNSKQTLFYESNEIWMSDIQIIESQNKFLDKLKISFGNESYNSCLFQILFCEKFASSTGLISNIKSQKIKFDEPKSLFENKKILLDGLNRVLIKKTYFYEDTDLKKIYNEIFDEELPKSQIIINIKKLSVAIVMKNNNKTFNFVNKFLIYKNMCSNQLDVMQDLNENNEEINTEKKNVNNKIKNNPSLESNNYKLSINNEYNNDNNDEDSQNNPIINFKKLSPHIIDLSINKISFKVTEDEDKKIKEKGTFIIINNIKYIEKKDISVNEEKVKNLIEIESIKVYFAVPNYVNNLENFKKGNFEKFGFVEILDNEKMIKILEQLKKNKNNILGLLIEDIKLIQNQERKVIFQIQKQFKIGLIDRKDRENIKSESKINFKETIFGIYTLDEINSLNDNNKNLFFHPINNKPIKIGNLSTENFKTKYCLEIAIKKEGLIPMSTQRRGYNLLTEEFIFPEQEFKLFGEMINMIKIIIESIKLNPKYFIDVNVGFIYFKFISSIFNYIYFIRNYTREENQVFKKTFENYQNLIKNENEINLSKDESDNEINTIKRQQTTKIKNNLDLDEKDKRYLNDDEVNKLFKRQKSFLRSRKKHNYINVKTTLEIKSSPLLLLSIPMIVITFEQVENNILKTFTYFILNNISGEMSFSEKVKDDFLLIISIKEIFWKGDAKCEDLIKCNSDYNAITITVYLTRKINSYDPKIEVNLNHLKIIFLFKVLKEIILFIDLNSACLDENPKKEDIDNLLVRNKIDEMLALIKGNDLSIIIPEDSQSANYLCLNVNSIQVKIKKADLNPKIFISPNKEKDSNPLIIDIKTIYNIHSIESQINEYIPHTLIFINGKKINGFFCINKKKEKLAEINEINLIVKQPSNDHEITLMRKKLWKKANNNSSVVTYKPSLNINLKGHINSFLGNLLSLKIFIDSNFDEESNIKFLSEKNPNFDTIELEINVDDAFVNLEMYKCFKENLDKVNIQKIDKILPGKNDDIIFNENQDYEDLKEKIKFEEFQNNNEENYFRKITQEKIDSIRSHYGQEYIKEIDEESNKSIENEKSIIFTDT